MTEHNRPTPEDIKEVEPQKPDVLPEESADDTIPGKNGTGPTYPEPDPNAGQNA